MKKGIQYLISALLLLIVVGSIYIEFSHRPVYEVQDPTIGLDTSAQKVAEGKRISKTICIRCHYNERTNTLAGRQHGNPKRLGDFSSGNITRDSATGIGKWTNGQLYYFLKTGIKPDGDYVFDMPKYLNLSEEDLLSIIAFLKSDDTLVRRTDNPNPPPQFSFLTKLLLHTVVAPPAYIDKKISAPDTNDPVLFGKYLATSKFSCYECHSLNMVTNNYNDVEKSWGFFKGGNPQVNEDREKVYTPNITGDKVLGIGKWTEPEFERTVRTGIKPDGRTVKDPMFPFYLLTDKEVHSIYLYLKSLK
jgi:mono/diheme cytochrome c family protein